MSMPNIQIPLTSSIQTQIVSTDEKKLVSTDEKKCTQCNVEDIKKRALIAEKLYISRGIKSVATRLINGEITSKQASDESAEEFYKLTKKIRCAKKQENRYEAIVKLALHLEILMSAALKYDELAPKCGLQVLNLLQATTNACGFFLLALQNAGLVYNHSKRKFEIHVRP